MDAPVRERAPSPRLSAPAPAPETASLPAPDIGILLVHGIGSHKQGETLNEFAAPLVKWIDRWLVRDLNVQRLVGQLANHLPTKDYEGTASFRVGTLRPPDLPLDTPAHARATIAAKAAGRPDIEQAWLFAESWWSPQTLTPRVSPFLLWLITRGPWLILMHLSQRFGVDYPALLREIVRSRSDPAFSNWVYWRLAKFAGVTLGWLVISLIVIALWCIVSVVALVPIGYVRKQVYAVLIEITGVVGDSYVLVNDPIQRVAFANSARRALDWLHRQGCAKIAVVAHSQGAAVARDVLMEAGARQVDLFVTLGPGIAKLHALSERERTDPQSFIWAGAAAPLAFLTLALFVRFALDGETGFALWAGPALAFLVMLVAVFLSWHYVGASRQALEPDALHVLRMKQWQPAMKWRDFHASHDPVSNGPLSTTIGARWGAIVSRKVMVLGSVLADHTAYWTSRADFVPRVVAALDRCAGTGLFPSRAGLCRVARGSAVYRRAVFFLRVQRWGGLLALALPVFAFGRVRSVAGDLHTALADVPVESVHSVVERVDATLGWLGSHLIGGPVSGDGATAFVLLLVIAAVVLHVWGRIVHYWWQHLAAALLTPVFAPSAGGVGGRTARGLLIGLVAALGALPPVLSVAWTFFPETIAWASLRRFIGMFVTLVCMVGVGIIVFALAAMTRDYWRQFKAARNASLSVWHALLALPSLWALLVGWVLYGGVLSYLLWLNRYTAQLLPYAAGLVVLGALIVALRRVRPGRWWRRWL